MKTTTSGIQSNECVWARFKSLEDLKNMVKNNEEHWRKDIYEYLQNKYKCTETQAMGMTERIIQKCLYN